MRRKNQQLTEAECSAVLESASSGVLAVAGDGGYPYAVPLSFVYENGDVYFHCAAGGHKLDALRRDARVSFCVIALDDVMPEKFTTRYRSVILFGRASEVKDETEKRRLLFRLGRKYSPGRDEELQKEADSQLSRVCIIRLQTEHMTGKEAIELVREAGKAQPKI